MSRALVALDQLIRLTDGSDADLASLLLEVVRLAPLAGPWRSARLSLAQTWAREAILIAASGERYPAFVEVDISGRGIRAETVGAVVSWHPSVSEAQRACENRLRALGWRLL